MKKLIINLAILIGITSAMPAAIADEVILSNGETVKGKIDYILSGFIGINTDTGFKKISREAQVDMSRDIVTVGFKNPKKITGLVYLLNTEYLEISTSSGKLTIPRRKIRDIILAEETL